MRIENIMREIIESANNHHDYKMADTTYKLLSKFAGTCNCPSNWRDIGEPMAEEYAGDE